MQVASVIGMDVPFALLQAIAELPDEALHRGLDHLQAAEFLLRDWAVSGSRYVFKHALTHEVAYGGLLPERRREMHARIVEAIETLYRDRLAEQIERLAHHTVQGEFKETAVHYLRQAGLKPTRAIGALQRLGPGSRKRSSFSERSPKPVHAGVAFDIRLELRPVLVSARRNPVGAPAPAQAEALAQRWNDDSRRGRVCAFMTTSLATRRARRSARPPGAARWSSRGASGT